MRIKKDSPATGQKKKKKASDAVQAFNNDNTAARIISAATRLFADQGYEGTSVKDICDAAGAANISAVNYHFGSKENLFRRIVEQFGVERLEFVRRTLQPPQNAEDFRVRLEIFLYQTLEAMISQKDIVRVILRDIEMKDSRIRAMDLETVPDSTAESKERDGTDVIKRHDKSSNSKSGASQLSSFDVHREKIVEFFEHAQKKGIIAPDIMPTTVAAFLMSNLAHQTRNESMVKAIIGHSVAEEDYRNLWVQQTLRILTGGIMAKVPPESRGK